MMSESDYKVKEAPTCPHCQQVMEQMDARHLDWGTTFLWVCFNNNCVFFMKGWKHMMDTYGQLVSYRYMVTPDNGSQGVIPAFSHEYLRAEGKSCHGYQEADVPENGREDG
jgi:hypothetical protein